MIKLDMEEVKQITAGLHLNVITAVIAVVAGAVTGGPVGVGYAVSIILMNEGANNLKEMHHNGQNSNPQYWF